MEMPLNRLMQAPGVISYDLCRRRLELTLSLEMEPFDEALDRQIWSLAKTRLQWHKRTAEARRTIPSEIEANIFKLYEQHKEVDTVSLSHADEDMEELSVDEKSMPL
jgi:hypothetical protein